MIFMMIISVYMQAHTFHPAFEAGPLLFLLSYNAPNELTCEFLARCSVFASHFTDAYLSIQHLVWVMWTELSNQVFLLSESPPWPNSKSRN